MVLVTDIDSGKSILIETKELFTVHLKSNITTGCCWDISETDAGLRIVSRNYVSDPVPASALGIICGNGGTENFVLQADTEGTFRLCWNYKRPRSAEVYQTFILDVIAACDATIE